MKVFQFRGLVLSTLLLSCVGCDDEVEKWENPTKVCEAPSGNCWDWECASGECSAAINSETDPEGIPDCADGADLITPWTASRFFSINVICYDPNVGGGCWSAFPWEARPLICDTSAQCPQMGPGLLYECVSGLCQNEDTSEYPRDVLDNFNAESLCFAAFDRSETVDNISYALDVWDEISEGCASTLGGECTGTLPSYCWEG